MGFFWWLGWVGVGFLVWRMWPRFPSRSYPRANSDPYPNADPFVSIIVPARNEEENLGRLLPSLKALEYENYEIIVVDDRSTDETRGVAESAGIILVEGEEAPEGWMGKAWACHQGAKHARGDILLFTDADTQHRAAGLKRAVREFCARQLEMMSVLPFHRTESLWEALLGPFHVILLAVTGPLQKPTPRRVFAIGQYLMFTKTCYQRMGGHTAVRAELVEDVPMAQRCLLQGERYGVAKLDRVFEVRMYTSFGEFCRGWRRNFRAGLKASSWLAPLEITAYIAAVSGGGKWFFDFPAAVLVFATAAVFLKIQKTLGEFSPFGPILGIWSAAVFSGITALSVIDMVFKRPQRWKGRAFLAGSVE